MSKRFTDTSIWQKEWFMTLSLKRKMLVKFIFDNCDCAGIYEPNFTLVSFYIGEPVTADDLKGIKQLRLLKNGNYYIEDFIQFQYGVAPEELKPTFSIHKGVIKSLEKNGVNLKEEEKKEETKGEELDVDAVQMQFVDAFAPDIQECFKVYKEECKDLISLSFERKNRRITTQLKEVFMQLDNDVGKFRELCKKANSLGKIGVYKIDFQMMLNNFIGILNDKYTEKEGSSILERLGRK